MPAVDFSQRDGRRGVHGQRGRPPASASRSSAPSRPAARCVVRVHRKRRRRGAIAAQILTSPFHLVAIPKHDGDGDSSRRSISNGLPTSSWPRAASPRPACLWPARRRSSTSRRSCGLTVPLAWREVVVVRLHLGVVRRLDLDRADFARLQQAVDDALAAGDDARRPCRTRSRRSSAAGSAAVDVVLHLDRRSTTMSLSRLVTGLVKSTFGLAADGRRELLAGEHGVHRRRRPGPERQRSRRRSWRRRASRRTTRRARFINPLRDELTANREVTDRELYRNYISPFQSSGSGLTERKISMCHLPPPHGSMTSAATTSTRISENSRPFGVALEVIGRLVPAEVRDRASASGTDRSHRRRRSAGRRGASASSGR